MLLPSFLSDHGISNSNKLLTPLVIYPSGLLNPLPQSITQHRMSPIKSVLAQYETRTSHLMVFTAAPDFIPAGTL